MKTLIIYASKYGCAERCAKSLAQKIREGADLVNIKSANISDISKYEKVIIGGSIYVGQIQKEVKTFCINNLQELKVKKVGLFICCGFAENFNQHMENAFPKELLDTAVVKEVFGGELNTQNMKFLDRLMTKMVTKATAKKGASQEPPRILTNNIDKFAKSINDI